MTKVSILKITKAPTLDFLTEKNSHILLSRLTLDDKFHDSDIDMESFHAILNHGARYIFYFADKRVDLRGYQTFDQVYEVIGTSHNGSHVLTAINPYVEIGDIFSPLEDMFSPYEIVNVTKVISKKGKKTTIIFPGTYRKTP